MTAWPATVYSRIPPPTSTTVKRLVAAGHLDLVSRWCVMVPPSLGPALSPRAAAAGPIASGSMRDRTSSRGILAGPVDGPRRIPGGLPLGRGRGRVDVTHLGSRFRGIVLRVEHDGGVVLRSPASGLERVFRMHPGSFSLSTVRS